MSITSPVSGATLRTTGTLSLVADAKDNVGVARVEFYDSEKLLGSVMGPPWTYGWSVTSPPDPPRFWLLASTLRTSKFQLPP